MIEVIDACKLLYDNFDEKRREVGLHHKNVQYINAKACLFYLVDFYFYRTIFKIIIWYQVKAEKAKRIRELTDPDHAWDTHEEEPEPAPSTNAVAAIGS